MTGDPPGVPRRAGGHAADRLREQLEREFGVAGPQDEPDADSTDSTGADSAPAGTDESEPDAGDRPDPGRRGEH
jgi:hypothetical protein